MSLFSVIGLSFLVLCFVGLGFFWVYESGKICKWKGHKEITREIKIRKLGRGLFFGPVAEDFKAKVKQCSRCGKHLSDVYDEELWVSWDGCTMPESMWDDIREKGYTVL